MFFEVTAILAEQRALILPKYFISSPPARFWSRSKNEGFFLKFLTRACVLSIKESIEWYDVFDVYFRATKSLKIV